MTTKTGMNQHVVPHGKQWAVRPAGADTVSRTFNTQREAIAYAKAQAKAQHSELLIHNREGQIRKRNTYGYDPYPPEG